MVEESLYKKTIAERKADVLSNRGSQVGSMSSLKVPAPCNKTEVSHVIPSNKVLNPDSPSFYPVVNSSAFLPVEPTDDVNNNIVCSLSAALNQFCNQQIIQNDRFLEIHEKQIASHHSSTNIGPPIFMGDVILYPSWRSAFNVLIYKKIFDDSEKLFLLGKFTGGKPRKMIQTYLSLGTSKSYKLALDLLDEYC